MIGLHLVHQLILGSRGFIMPAKPCPGSGIRSGGKGRKLGTGGGQGPLGTPVGDKLEDLLKRRRRRKAARPGG